MRLFAPLQHIKDGTAQEEYHYLQSLTISQGKSILTSPLSFAPSIQKATCSGSPHSWHCSLPSGLSWPCPVETSTSRLLVQLNRPAKQCTRLILRRKMSRSPRSSRPRCTSRRRRQLPCTSHIRLPCTVGFPVPKTSNRSANMKSYCHCHDQQSGHTDENRACQEQDLYSDLLRTSIREQRMTND